MKICIDMRPALSMATGVGTYLLNLTRALSRIDSQNEYHLFSSSWKERFKMIYGPNFVIHDWRVPVRSLNYSWHRFSWPPIETLLRSAVDVAHSPTPLLIPSKHAHRVNMVHDLYFYFHPEHTIREMQRDYPALLAKHCKESDAIISVSDYTKEQLVEHLKVPASKVYTIRHGADPFYEIPATQEELDGARKKFGLQRPYFLFVGALEPRKNIPLLLDAFSKLKEDVNLVLAGPDGWGFDWSSIAHERAIRTHYVAKEELRALYQQGVALVLPSVEEGFGLPLLEAMSAGLPIIASNIPVFREVCSDAFLSFQSNSVEELTSVLARCYSDAELRKDLAARG
ncbi:MAG TPA: glycosyltransferase family 1 protein, partial [Acidobacteriota bacterium]